MAKKTSKKKAKMEVINPKELKMIVQTNRKESRGVRKPYHKATVANVVGWLLTGKVPNEPSKPASKS